MMLPVLDQDPVKFKTLLLPKAPLTAPLTFLGLPLTMKTDSNTSLSGTTVSEMKILHSSLLLLNPTLLPLDSTEEVLFPEETMSSKYVLSMHVEQETGQHLPLNPSIKHLSNLELPLSPI